MIFPVFSGFRIPEGSEIVGVLGWPVPCRETDWWSRGGGRWNGVVSQCGWDMFFVNDGQTVICSPNYHLLKPSSDPSLLWSGRCLLEEWRNDKAWGAIRVERILGTKHSWMQMPMGEAHGWKALKSYGCFGKVEHVLSFYSHLKKNEALHTVHHSGLELSDSWSSSPLKFINEEAKAWELWSDWSEGSQLVNGRKRLELEAFRV